MALSDAARSAWAKSLKDGAWLPLWQHMDDAADVAAGLFDAWLPTSVRRVLADPLGGDLDAARAALMFLAGLHDLGKATPAFAVQDQALASRMREHGLSIPLIKDELPARDQVRHALAGHHLLRRWLMDRGWSAPLAGSWAVVVGGHHGVPPDPVSLGEGAPWAHPMLYGEGLWPQVQQELITRVAVRTGADIYLNDWREVAPSAQFQVLVTGLVIVSDWLASTESLLAHTEAQLPEVSNDTMRGSSALQRLALPAPWRPVSMPSTVAKLFAARYELPAGAGPRPVQHAAYEVAEAMSEPGLMIIEAPMGEGKTEAALAAAEVMARRWGAGGLQVALPTQATSDAMFDRVLGWLDTMGHSTQTIGAITLSHGKARFNRTYQGLFTADRPAGIGCDEDSTADRRRHPAHSVVAHSWLSGRKKSQLANFVVGTIDQVLFAALKARHLMLRHLALAGKVVVLDEVHAYDAFMNSYLMKVLTWLGAYRVPVVALSATLPAGGRQALLEAYLCGQASGDATPQEAVLPSGNAGYPVISWTEAHGVRLRAVAPSGRTTAVSIDALGGGADDDTEELIGVLREALTEGGCALVVRNTVQRVLSTAATLRRCFPGEVTIAHARFITADRLRNDNDLLDRFGSPGRASSRPRRHIVVASQVVEQSLDVDFDLLITDLAPADLVLQRMGRLHRHQRGSGQSERPPKLRSARTYIAGAEFCREPPRLARGSERVYGSYLLLCAAAVLAPRFGSTVGLPDDIPLLVDRAYREDVDAPSSWAPAVTEARRRWLDETTTRTAHARAFQIADPTPAGAPILGWVWGNVGDTDDDSQGQGQVRDGEPSLEVILVVQDGSGDWWTPAWLPDGQARLPIPQNETPSGKVVFVLASCVVRLPVQLSDAASEQVLWSATPALWAQSSLLHRLPVMVIGEDHRGFVNGRPIRYTPHAGLEVLDQ